MLKAKAFRRRLCALTILGLSAAGLQAQQPSAEYIRLGGRVIAIERQQSISVAITPETFTVEAGLTQQFTATVTPSTALQAVTWTVEPTSAGEISADGLFTAASGITSDLTATIRAVSVADPTKSDTVSGTITVVPSQVCSLNPTSGTVPNAGGSLNVSVSCPVGTPWTASAGAYSWVSFSPGSGTGPLTISVIAANQGGTSARTANVTIAGKTFTLNQSAPSVVTVSPASVQLDPTQRQTFIAYVDGVPTAVAWSISGVGTIDQGGNYTAPAIVFPDQINVTVIATHAAGNGTGTASIELEEYAPPNALVISPNSGNQLTQTFTLTVGDVHGANAVSYIYANFNAAIDQFLNGCEVLVTTRVDLGAPTVQLALDGSGWTYAAQVGTPGVLQNAQCRVDVGASTVTRSGNYVYVALPVSFKPGFIGSEGIFMRALNNTNADTGWVQVGTWNLLGNVPALPPSVALEAPVAGATVQGDVTISGWALDNTTQIENAISGVEVRIDGQTIGYATTGISRPDVCTTYPSRMGCPNVGFQIVWNTRNYTNAAHTIEIIATDTDNPAKTTTITRSVTVNNPPALPLVISPSPAWVRLQCPNSQYGSGACPVIEGPIAVEMQQFTPTVGGVQVTDVTWSLSQPPLGSPGTISTTGLYTAPSMELNSAGASVTVYGQRQSNPAQSSSASITLKGVVLPDGMTIYTGQQYWFYADTTLTNWTISPAYGTIDQSGYYRAPTSGTYNTTVWVSARSIYNANAKSLVSGKVLCVIS